MSSSLYTRRCIENAERDWDHADGSAEETMTPEEEEALTAEIAGYEREADLEREAYQDTGAGVPLTAEEWEQIPY